MLSECIGRSSAPPTVINRSCLIMNQSISLLRRNIERINDQSLFQSSHPRDMDRGTVPLYMDIF